MKRKGKGFITCRFAAVLLLAAVVIGCAVPCLAIPPVERMVLANGLVLLTCREPSLPVVTVHMLINGGSADDPAGKEGIAGLTAGMLTLGTARRSAVQISEELDFMGAEAGGEAGKDFSTVGMKVLRKDLYEGFALLMDVVQEASFREDELAQEVTKRIAAVQAEEDQPGQVAARAFARRLYGDGPYGHEAIGTKESLQRLSRDDAVRFHHHYYRPNNAIVVIVGDIDRESVEKITERLEGWPKDDGPPPRRQQAVPDGPGTVTIDRPVTQSNIIIGHQGITRDNPDYYAVTVMNYILGGGGFSSRLMATIRNDRGLAYSVDSLFNALRTRGEFEIVLQTKNASGREAIALALKEMETMQQKPVSGKELEGARKYMVGSFPLRFNTQGKIAGFLSLVEYFGLGLDYPERYPALIKAVSAADVQRVAARYLRPDGAVVVIVADLKEAGIMDESNKGGKP